MLSGNLSRVSLLFDRKPNCKIAQISPSEHLVPVRPPLQARHGRMNFSSVPGKSQPADITNVSLNPNHALRKLATMLLLMGQSIDKRMTRNCGKHVVLRFHLTPYRALACDTRGDQTVIRKDQKMLHGNCVLLTCRLVVAQPSFEMNFKRAALFPSQSNSFIALQPARAWLGFDLVLRAKVVRTGSVLIGDNGCALKREST